MFYVLVFNMIKLLAKIKQVKLWLKSHISYQQVKGILMQIWKSANIFAFIWKLYAEDFTLKHLLLFEICAHEVCEKFIYKHSEIIEYVENYPTF